MLFVIWIFQMNWIRFDMILLLFICKFAATFYMYILCIHTLWLKTQQCPNVFFHSIIVHLEYMWRKWLQSVWNHEFCIHHELMLAHKWERTIISVCHYWYMTQLSTLLLLISGNSWSINWARFVLFFVLLGGGCFLFLLYICSSLSLVYIVLMPVLHMSGSAELRCKDGNFFSR